MTTSIVLRILPIAVFGLGCRGREHHDGSGHDDHAHAAASELPTQSFTVWAERTELFMEYHPLIVGKETKLAAHVTEMPSFKAVTAGTATLTLTMKDGAAITGTANAPSDPGIFRPAITPKTSGPCELRMAIAGPQLTETFVVGPCEVFPDEPTARAKLPHEPEPPGRITFLKEQQWKTDFATIAVVAHDLQDGVRAAGEIQPVAGREARLTAPASGRVALIEPTPVLGVPVKKGQVLATIAPRMTGGGDRSTIAADVGAAAAEAEAARLALDRATRLVAAQAAPARTVEEANTRLKIAEARLAGSRGRLGQFEASATGGGGGRVFQIRSPIDGTLVAMDAASGQGVEEGQTLMTVIDLDRVWLVAKVFEPDVPKVEGARAATFTIDGYDRTFSVDQTNGKLVTVGRVVDPRTRTVPVIFDVDNTAGKLRIGNFTKTVIATGVPRNVLALPDAAIVDDAGKSIAFVMIEGEAFERRPLRLGIRSTAGPRSSTASRPANASSPRAATRSSSPPRPAPSPHTVTCTEAPMDRIIHWSIANRLFVVIASLGVLLYGGITVRDMPVDVFPDLTAPTVTVVTEAHGLAPQEVEALVSFPIESAVNGSTGVRRVRSSSGIGISIVWVEFDWGTDIYVARQIVNEKLQLVAAQIPPDVGPPTLAPISSIMGEIVFVAVRSDRAKPTEVREIADWVIRRRLLAMPGVAQVIPIGGAVRQYQVRVDPDRLRSFDVTLDQVETALRESNQNSTGGFFVRGGQESLIRGVGRIGSADDIADTVVIVRDGSPIRVGQIAAVEIGPGIKRGEGSSNAEPAVVLGIQKQPGANTLDLTARIDHELDAIQLTLPDGMTIERNKVRQADFIELAIHNVATSLRDGAILVAIILFVFLLNVRTTLISLVSIPLSLLVAMIVMRIASVTINTMTLGGLTIAIGALVDDAIIDVENVFRRLRENRALPAHNQRPATDVIFDASREVRSSIVFATLIVMLVFLPLFFLSGVEGRLLWPLGFAYLVAIFASLVVALTVTPALCAYVLPHTNALGHAESIVVRVLKRGYRPILRRAIAHPHVVVIAATAILAGAVALVPFLGRTFLPEFNEGALTVSAVTLPGTSLEESDRLGRRVEQVLLSFPEVASTARRTGRAELDEHAQDVNAAEIDVRLGRTDRSKEAFLEELRKQLTTVPGVVCTIGGPIAHRIDHMLSGTRASIAIKVFGDDLTQLRTSATQIKQVMESIDGVVDLSLEQQVDIPQLAITFDREAIARYGLRTGALAETVETAYAGTKVTQVLENQRTYDVIVRYRDDTRADVESIRNTVVDTPSGAKVPLRMLATIRDDVGPNTISRENVQRKVVVSANVSGRDLGSVIDDIRAAIDRAVKLPTGYYVVYGGQFESERAASRTITVLGGFVIAGIFLLLFLSFRSTRNALLIMVNLPLALIGGVVSVYLTTGVLSIASLVGFITLFGIATRNGIMMISHYEHLRLHEGATFDDAVLRGSLERLSPVLMTALCAGLALIPLVIAGGETGNELQAPMGIVILGGLLSSTALNMLVVPALYGWVARPRAATATLAPTHLDD